MSGVDTESTSRVTRTQADPDVSGESGENDQSIDRSGAAGDTSSPADVSHFTCTSIHCPLSFLRPCALRVVSSSVNIVN